MSTTLIERLNAIVETGEVSRSALARAAGERGGTAPCAFNAANEVAVAAFLDGRLGFLEIAEVVAETLDAVDGTPARDLDDLVEADGQARRLAARRLQPA